MGLFTASVATTLAGNFGIVDMFNLVFHWPAVWQNFQIWRLATCVFFFGKLGFPFLINVFFLYKYSEQLERGHFQGQRADYVYMLLVLWVVLLAMAILLDLVIVGPALVIGILYVWCSNNPDVIVNFWFGSQFPAMYMPWVL